MLSEHTSIDEFIRKKEDEFTLPGSHEDAHWQQMKTMLSTPGKTTPGKLRRQIIRRRIIGYTGGFITITVITTVILFGLRAHNSKKAGTAIAKPPYSDIHQPMAATIRPPGQPPVHAVAKSVIATTTVAQKAPSGTASFPRASYTRQVSPTPLLLLSRLTVAPMPPAYWANFTATCSNSHRSLSFIPTSTPRWWGNKAPAFSSPPIYSSPKPAVLFPAR